MKSILANNLKKARTASRLTQIEVGNAIGVTDKVIASYEQDVNIPTLSNYFKLCALYKIAPSKTWEFYNVKQSNN